MKPGIMHGIEICGLVCHLPADGPYFQRVFWDQPRKLWRSTLAERLEVALNDTAFGFNLARSFAQASMRLPDFIIQPAISRAYCWLRFPDCHDLNVAAAQVLNLPGSMAQRNVLRALLCCQDASLEEIASACGLDRDVVELFSQLFWNVNDRLDEPLFIAQLLYPRTRYPGPAERAAEIADSGLRLCRLGYEQGMAAVMRAAGPHLIDDGQGNPQGQLDGLERELMIRARAGVGQGLIDPEDNPYLDAVMPLILAAKRQVAGTPVDDDTRRGLAGMSISTAIQESFNRIMYPQRDRMLALQRGLDARKAQTPQGNGAPARQNPAK